MGKNLGCGIVSSHHKYGIMLRGSMIVISQDQWGILWKRLGCDYPQKVLLLRANLKKELGFVYRFHWDYRTRETNVHLDFYDQRLMSWFVLKYAEFIQ